MTHPHDEAARLVAEWRSPDYAGDNNTCADQLEALLPALRAQARNGSSAMSDTKFRGPYRGDVNGRLLDADDNAVPLSAVLALLNRAQGGEPVAWMRPIAMRDDETLTQVYLDSAPPTTGWTEGGGWLPLYLSPHAHAEGGVDKAAEYARHNPLGGPAGALEAAAARIRNGEEYYSVLEDFGFVSVGPHEPREPLIAAYHALTPAPVKVAASQDPLAGGELPGPDENCPDCEGHGCVECDGPEHRSAVPVPAAEREEAAKRQTAADQIDCYLTLFASAMVYEREWGDPESGSSPSFYCRFCDHEITKSDDHIWGCIAPKLNAAFKDANLAARALRGTVTEEIEAALRDALADPSEEELLNLIATDNVGMFHPGPGPDRRTLEMYAKQSGRLLAARRERILAALLAALRGRG